MQSNQTDQPDVAAFRDDNADDSGVEVFEITGTVKWFKI